MLILTFKILVIFYVLVCAVMFFFQERFIFFPEKLQKDHRFGFPGDFEEMYFSTTDKKSLHGLLFRAERPEGLVFYLHGNAGSLGTWGEVAATYTVLNYDVVMLDYRGYGKSEGSISGQEELFEDVQLVYNDLKKRYREENIVVLGYSLGTGPATRLASANNPKLLILEAPYFSLVHIMRRNYPVLPTFILKYKFRTDEFIRNCRMPVVIFHGDRDDVIHYENSLKLKPLLKATDTLITLAEQGHHDISNNHHYRSAISKILTSP